MEQDRISSRDPGAIIAPAPTPAEAARPRPAPAPAAPAPAPPAPEPAGPAHPNAMTSLHLPATVDPLEPADQDTAFARTRRLRHDGWTPDRMRTFLERFAECGVVSEACQAAGMSARAAYNLRDRDPLFAAGWDAACLKARPRLADEAFARAMTGVVERIYKDGVVVAERHRHDNRLTMSVLARLDARFDRAVADGAPHLELAARWDDYLAALAENRRDDIVALLMPPDPAEEAGKNAPDDELHELHQREGAVTDPDEPEGGYRVWDDVLGNWWTNYPPPEGYRGEQVSRFGCRHYKRLLTRSEQAVIDAREAEKRSRALARRDAWFGFGSEATKAGEGTPAAPPAPPPPGQR